MMTLSDYTNVAHIAGAVAVIISVLLLIRELREGNLLTRASNTQTLVGLSSPFHLALIKDRQIAELCVRGPREFAAMDEVDQYRYKTLLVWWLVFHENVYYQWRRGLLDQHIFQPWDDELKEFLQQQKLRLHWEGMKHLFQQEFARHVASLLSAQTAE